MLKRILNLVQKDFINGLRDNIFVYALIAPLVLSLLLRFFIPALSTNSINVVLLEKEKSSVLGTMEELAQVEYVENLAGIKERVLKWDDTLGIIRTKEKDKPFKIIIEGNEDKAVVELTKTSLNKVAGKLKEVKVKDINLEKPGQPAYQILAIFMCFMPLMIGGMLTGFALTEEKELRTRQSLNVTPLTNLEYILGKTLLGMTIALVMAVIIILILGMQVNWPQFLLVTCAGLFLSMIFGFFVGAISNNQLTAIANSKISSMFFVIPPILTLFIPKGTEILLYWIPTYWTFAGYRSLFWGVGNWEEILPIVGWNMVTNLIFLVIIYFSAKRYESRA